MTDIVQHDANNVNNNITTDKYKALTPRDFISLRVNHEKLEDSKRILKSLNYNNIESKLPTVLDTLNFLKYAFRRDLDAAYEFGRIGGHQVILKMLTTFDDDSEDLLNSLGEVIDACSASCLQFPMHSSTTIKLEERRVPLKISLNIGDSSNEDLKEILIRTIPKDVKEIASSDKTNLTVGYYLWDSSIAMVYWLVKNNIIVQSKKVLELGCGAGLAGIVAAAFASEVYLCDFNLKVVENANFNIKLNSMKHHVDNEEQSQCCCIPFEKEHVKSVEFDWDHEDFSIYEKDNLKKESMEVILGADVVCQESDCFNIARVIKYFLKKDFGVAYFIIGAQDSRFGVEKFEEAMLVQGLHVENMDEVINKNDEYKNFIAINEHFNSRPLDKYKMFKVISK